MFYILWQKRNKTIHNNLKAIGNCGLKPWLTLNSFIEGVYVVRIIRTNLSKLLSVVCCTNTSRVNFRIYCNSVSGCLETSLSLVYIHIWIWVNIEINK